MAIFQVQYQDGSIAKNTKVDISVENSGMARGFTDEHGYVCITTSGNRGKIIINGVTQHEGSLNISLVTIR